MPFICLSLVPTTLNIGAIYLTPHLPTTLAISAVYLSPGVPTTLTIGAVYLSLLSLHYSDYRRRLSISL